MASEEMKYGAIIVAVIGAVTTIVVAYMNKPAPPAAEAPKTASASVSVAGKPDSLDDAKSKIDALYADHEKAFIRKDISALEGIYTLDCVFTDVDGKQQDLQSHTDHLIQNLAKDECNDTSYAISNIQASNNGYDVEWNEHIEWLESDPDKKDRHQRTSSTKRLAHWIVTDHGLLTNTSRTLSISTTTDGKPDRS